VLPAIEETDMHGNCPKCEKMLAYVNIDTVDGRTGIGGSVWKTAIITCPHCTTALGSQIDPIAIKTDIINGLMKRLGK
jgi:hypothetical protein